MNRRVERRIVGGRGDAYDDAALNWLWYRWGDPRGYAAKMMGYRYAGVGGWFS